MGKCCEELATANFYCSILVEGISVALLMFISGLSFIRFDASEQKYLHETGVVFGIILAVLIQCSRNISDSHLNPVITMACLLTRRVSLIRGFCYVIFQCGGAILGTFALREFEPLANDLDFMMTRLATDISVVKGLGYEMIFTFLLVLLYFSSTSPKSNSFKTFDGPLAIGLFYYVSYVLIAKYTGCSLNPARSLGPAVLNLDFRDHWIYWAGPITSGCFAGLLHDLVFKQSRKKTPIRPRSCSLICCKQSREDLILSDFISRQDYIVPKPEESV